MVIFRGIEFPYTHDLSRLSTMLESSGEKLSEQIRKAGTLTKYARVLRYPANYGEVYDEDYRDAVAIAESVMLWAEGILGCRVIRKGS